MAIFCRCFFIFVLFLMMESFSFAIPKEQIEHRNFWQPMYHGERLNYCSFDRKSCGLALANRYCQLMGYVKADQAIKDNNIGLTNYLMTTYRCQGWECNGFKTIRCVGSVSHKPPQSYHYRYRRFVFPRYNNYRVAWCYDGEKNCGRRAAYSFCRRMGYLQASKYKIDKCLPATQAIGNQKLCFGALCNGFAQIDCFR